MIRVDEDAIGSAAEQLVIAMMTARNKDGLRIVVPGPDKAEVYRAATLLALQYVAMNGFGPDEIVVSSTVTHL